MTKLLTREFKQHQAKTFYDDFDPSSNTTYYLVGGRYNTFDGNTIPTPDNSIDSTFWSFHDEAMFGKKLEQTNLRYMIDNIEWVSNTAYDMYDNTKDTSNSNYFVVSDQLDGTYGVFKCIYKTPFSEPKSLVRPLVNRTSPADEVLITGDGYHWKLMGTISAVDYANFATNNYVPMVPNTEISANAVPGTIDAIVVESQGLQYNSYAVGNIKQSSIGGNSQLFYLNSADFVEVNTYDLINIANGTFQEDDSLTITVPGQTDIQGTVVLAGGTYVSVVIDANTSGVTQATVELANTYITIENANNATADVISIRKESIPTLSDKDNFYDESAIYIVAGTGAGQIRRVSEYTLFGNERQIAIDEVFDVTPAPGDTFRIIPHIDIKGDGSDAKAIPVIDSTANSIIGIDIINRGSGYTYSTATVTGNTGVMDANGSIVQANTASLRPIIAPPGGHGFDALSELRGHKIGISAEFANTEVRDDVSFSTFGIVKDLLFNDIVLTLDALTTEFSNGEIVIQANTNASGVVTGINTANNQITLSDVKGLFAVSATDVITGQTNANTATISAINTDVSTYNKTLTLQINVLSGAYTVGETVSQANTEATATVASANSTHLELVRWFGSFSNTMVDIITGGTSGATAEVQDVTMPNVKQDTGEVLYIEHMDEITRSTTTTEKFKIVVEF